jgi:hypothetical protein
MFPSSLIPHVYTPHKFTHKHINISCQKKKHVHASSQQYSTLKGFQKNKVSIVLICISAGQKSAPFTEKKA